MYFCSSIFSFFYFHLLLTELFICFAGLYCYMAIWGFLITIFNICFCATPIFVLIDAFFCLGQFYFLGILLYLLYGFFLAVSPVMWYGLLLVYQSEYWFSSTFIVIYYIMPTTLFASCGLWRSWQRHSPALAVYCSGAQRSVLTDSNVCFCCFNLLGYWFSPKKVPCLGLCLY